MTSDVSDPVRVLLAESLKAWRIEGSVMRNSDGRLVVSAGAIQVQVENAPPDVPFRWFVTHGSRRRGAVSLVAVLRQVRGALDPGYETARVRIASPALGHSFAASSETSHGNHKQQPGGRTT